MSNLQIYHHFKLDFWKVEQHTGGKQLNHGTKRRKDNKLQSLELPCRILILDSKRMNVSIHTLHTRIIY